jgi:uncharacterized protein YoaH (UPF0181 family)
MATLNIDGRSVQVDDGFLSLSHDQQNATVEEIAKSLTPHSKLSDAVTDIPNEIKNAASENIDTIKKGITDRGTKGPIEGLIDTGKAVLAIPGLLASPLTGAARSLIGHPMAQAQHAVGTVIAPDIAAKDDPAKMYAAAKGDVDTAMSALASRGVPSVPAVVAAPAKAGEGQQVLAAAQRLSDAGVPVDVPRAISSDSAAVQRLGQGIRNVPIVGDAVPRATLKLVDDLGAANRTIADQYGSGSGPNVASRIGDRLSTAATSETSAAANAARLSDEAVAAAHERAGIQANQSLDAADTNALQQTRAAVGDMSPQDMGQALIERLRAGEQEARANKDRLYGIAERSDGAISAEAVPAMRPRIAQALTDAGREVDVNLTPAASRMMAEVDQFSRGGNADVTHGAVYPRSMQEIEQTRKRLNGFSQAATNDADRAATRMIIREFDGWVSDSFDNALFSGSDAALNAFREARAANTSWRARFGFNERDDADRVVNRIVTGETTPQEAANYIVGAGKVGAKGVSSRLLTRIAEATNDDPEAMQAIRGGIWNRLSQATGGVDAKPGAKVANDIGEFLNGSGRDVAQRLFSPQQQNIMRTYADTIRRTASAREHVSEVMANTKPGKMDVGVGPMQELANAVLGKGGKTDEALFSAIDSYAKSGGRGDIQTLSQIVQSMPLKDRGDLAGSIVRNLGISPRTHQFSPDVFVSQWQAYTPQAKTLLFGNAGPQRKAIDDIALVSERLKQIGQRFGNPSGTAQNANIFALAGAFIAAPLSTLAGATGGAIAAKILASPAGAASAAKWTNAYAALVTAPKAQTIGAFQAASRNLANTARSLGSNVTPDDFIRAIQSPSQGRADDKPDVPRPPGQ